MAREEVGRLLVLLDEAIHGARRSRREIERTMGMGQGYLNSLFRGRIELKVWHVFALAEVLGADPLILFARAAQPAPPAPADDLPAEPLPPISREEVEEIVRRTLRQELARMGGKDQKDLTGC